VCFAPSDPADPRNWRTGYRWFLMICAALEMTGGTLAISIFTSGFGQMRSVGLRKPAVPFLRQAKLVGVGRVAAARRQSVSQP